MYSITPVKSRRRFDFTWNVLCRLPKVNMGVPGRVVNKQSSMHTASEFDSGMPPVEHAKKKKKKNK